MEIKLYNWAYTPVKYLIFELYVPLGRGQGAGVDVG